MQPCGMLRPAAFLDRDGTIISEVHYIARPEHVELLPGAAEAIAMLTRAGFACVVVSNQSGVGRGKLTEADMHRVQAEVERQLAGAGAKLLAAYFCTVPPSADADTAPDRRSRVEHPDRKPGPGMLLRAAKEHGLDISRSVMVGDMLSDVLAGKNAGVMASVHVKTGHGMTQPEAMSVADFAATDLLEAAEWVVGRANQRTSERANEG